MALWVPVRARHQGTKQEQNPGHEREDAHYDVRALEVYAEQSYQALQDKKYTQRDKAHIFVIHDDFHSYKGKFQHRPYPIV